jgi:hypothetical protein
MNLEYINVSNSFLIALHVPLLVVFISSGCKSVGAQQIALQMLHLLLLVFH